jgi:hypothetical protein
MTEDFNRASGSDWRYSFSLQATATNECEAEAAEENQATKHDIREWENLISEYTRNDESYTDSRWNRFRSKLLEKDSARPVSHLEV